MKNIIILSLLLICTNTFGQTTDIAIIPEPVSLKVQKGSFLLDNNVTINDNDLEGAKNVMHMLTGYLDANYGVKLSITGPHPNGRSIRIEQDNQFNQKEGYGITITHDFVVLKGTAQGLFYAVQTFIQLLPSVKNGALNLPLISINDYPRFGYRGMHLDVCRHFFPTEFVKKYIDYLAFHKFNYFHWHLTDDQGWRIEIKKYEKLITIGSKRNGTIIGRYPGTGNDNTPHGGFYTQDEIRDVVKYAADRFITIIPEIEMPGHASAAIAAYPDLSCFPDESTQVPKGAAWSGSTTGKQVQQTWGVFEDVFCPTENTFTFLENVLDEVMALFPSKYIHIGGDECPKESWKRSPFCQQLIKEKGLKDENGLQSYFIQRIEKYVNSKGKSIVGWDEILEGGLAPNATVMSWRGEKGGIAAIKEGHHVIMTPDTYVYFDHSQNKHEDSVTIGGYLPLEKVYNYEPVPPVFTEAQASDSMGKAKFVLGAQANLWTEYITNPRKVEYMIFPRMSALSEVVWTPKAKKDWSNYQRKLPAMLKRYEFMGASYSKSYYDLQSSVLPSADFNGLVWKLESKNKEGHIIYVKGRSNNATFNYSKSLVISANGEYGAALSRKDHTFISNWIWQKFAFNKATGKKIILKDKPADNYPGSGAFTLVNGIVTTEKLSQSSEWLGFLGKDLDATIDLGKPQAIRKIALDVLRQEGSWIYPPSSVEFLTSADGRTFKSQAIVHPGTNGNWPNERKIEKEFSNLNARYIQIIAKNYGIIPSGQPGSGTPAWLFADEIEVE
ncbi:MAG: family 20 glycosylhydrolase [Ginsengibacter sp.]